MFKSLDDIKQYVEEATYTITEDPKCCYICGFVLANADGQLHYHVCDEYAPDEKFCSEKCIIEFLENKIGIEKDNE